MLVQEIGQATSTIMDIDKLIAAVLGIIEKRLDFDRGMIMLADRERHSLKYVAGYGHTSPEQKILLRQTTFNLNNPNSKGVFVLAMRERRPFLIENLSSIEDVLSAKSLEFARQLGSHSLICVPIVYEKECPGHPGGRQQQIQTTPAAERHEHADRCGVAARHQHCQRPVF